MALYSDAPSTSVSATARAADPSIRRYALYLATIPGKSALLESVAAESTATPSVGQRLWQFFLDWRERARVRRSACEVSQLDERLLADIGLTKGEPAYLALKANWHVEPVIGRLSGDPDQHQRWHRL